jgi:hypothetical protein
LWDNDALSWAVHSIGGMTLRDWFAGQALGGMMARKDSDMWMLKEVAGDCYAYADAMLKAREVKPEAATDQLTRESDNDTQSELAAWELLKQAREERDKAQALARELRDALAGMEQYYRQHCINAPLFMQVHTALTNAMEVLP